MGAIELTNSRSYAVEISHQKGHMVRGSPRSLRPRNGLFAPRHCIGKGQYHVRHLAPSDGQTCTWNFAGIRSSFAWLNRVGISILCPRSKTRVKRCGQRIICQRRCLYPMFLTSIRSTLHTTKVARASSVPALQATHPVSPSCSREIRVSVEIANMSNGWPPVPSKLKLSLTAGKYKDGLGDDGRCTWKKKKRLSYMSIN